jgi:hypothetical protein
MIYNLARAGTLRRELSVCNPVHYLKLAQCVVKHWSTLVLATSMSKLSLSKPVDTQPHRAIEREIAIGDLPKHRAAKRSAAKYLLRTDVTRFYQSVYTHSIPWALHTKAVAKTNRGPLLLGNELDQLVRNGQDAQTTGIPIGPDTSLLLAELILSQVDVALWSQMPINGIRYIDDYELAFQSEGDAKRAQNTLEGILGEYQLSLNAKKTEILQLPVPLQESWASELQLFRFSRKPHIQQGEIIRFFDRAFDLARENREEGVLKYVAGRLRQENICTENLNLLEDLLLQVAVVEAGSMPFVLAVLLRNVPSPRDIRRENKIQNALSLIIKEHAPLGHSSEVAWAIWSFLTLAININSDVSASIVDMKDPTSALVALHARNKGLLEKPDVLDSFQSFMTQPELYGPRWLLAYEADVKGWLPSADRNNHVDSDARFSQLKKAKVSFYDDAFDWKPAPTVIQSALHRLEDIGGLDLDDSLGEWDYTRSEFWNFRSR